MTTRSKKEDLARRRPKGNSVLGDLLDTVSAALETSERPDPARYRDDPVGFMRTFLGFDPYDRQQEIAIAARDHDRVTVVSATKCGKTSLCAAICLWYIFTRSNARAILTAPKFSQIQHIIWREIRLMFRHSGICVDCRKAGIKIAPCPHSVALEGQCNKLAATGLKGPGEAEILGLTAADADRMRGLSGPDVLFVVDEASAVADEVFDVIEASQSAGARVILISNPSRRAGYHYDSHHSKKDFWGAAIHISALDTPNARGLPPIPGLANRDYVERKKIERGAESAWFMINVLGQWPTTEDGRLYPSALTDPAREKWTSTPAEGRLVIACDPAGESMVGDATAIALRRGKKLFGLYAFRGLSIEAIVEKILELVRANRKPREIPIVVCDAGGIGYRVYSALICAPGTREFEPVAFQPFADPSPRRRRDVTKMRDEAYLCLKEWLKAGGTLPSDPLLWREMELIESFHDKTERQYFTKKDELRSILHRSPDRLDAVAMSTWVTPEEDEARDRARELEWEKAHEEDAADRGRFLPHERGVYDAAFGPYGTEGPR
jgi:hypothetical protein